MRYLLHLLLLPATALAGAGTVSEVEGFASRLPKGASAPVELKVGSMVEVGDTLEVAAGGNLAITLTDKSVIALGEGSKLTLDEARFGQQGSKVFSARLLLGSLWAKVTKLAAGSDSKFEVATERGVAGVRGTVFTVALGPGADAELEVGVEEGEVEVAHAVAEAAMAVAAAAAAATTATEAEAAPMGAGAGPERAAAAKARPEAIAAMQGAELLDRRSGAGSGYPKVQQAPPGSRFDRRERIAAGSSVTFGKRALARQRFQLRHAKMAAFVGRHRARWLKLAVDRELERGLKREMRKLREERRRR